MRRTFSLAWTSSDEFHWTIVARSGYQQQRRSLKLGNNTHMKIRFKSFKLGVLMHINLLPGPHRMKPRMELWCPVVCRWCTFWKVSWCYGHSWDKWTKNEQIRHNPLLNNNLTHLQARCSKLKVKAYSALGEATKESKCPVARLVNGFGQDKKSHQIYDPEPFTSQDYQGVKYRMSMGLSPMKHDVRLLTWIWGPYQIRFLSNFKQKKLWGSCRKITIDGYLSFLSQFLLV